MNIKQSQATETAGSKNTASQKQQVSPQCKNSTDSKRAIFIPLQTRFTEPAAMQYKKKKKKSPHAIEIQPGVFSYLCCFRAET